MMSYSTLYEFVEIQSLFANLCTLQQQLLFFLEQFQFTTSSSTCVVSSDVYQFLGLWSILLLSLLVTLAQSQSVMLLKDGVVCHC